MAPKSESSSNCRNCVARLLMVEAINTECLKQYKSLCNFFVTRTLDIVDSAGRVSLLSRTTFLHINGTSKTPMISKMF